MNSLLSRVVLVAITFGMAFSVNAQEIPTPDASLWTTDIGGGATRPGGATNPSGDEAVPAFIYDPESGDFWMDLLGLNRQKDTTEGSPIGGDDVGFIAAVIETPEAAQEVYLNGFVNGVVWDGQYFNGKQQIFGTPAGYQYADPEERINLFRFAPNLTPEDFTYTEIAVNFASGTAGAIMYGEVQFVEPVPEPSAFLLIAPVLAGFVGIARRRRR